MAKHTGIEWCDSTFNPWMGCTKVSPGCDHCYAEQRMDRRLHLVQWGAGMPRRRTGPASWSEPLRWQRQAAEFKATHGRRRRVFCASLADWLDNEVPIAWLVDLLELVRSTPDLDWLLLTKRIGNWAPRISEAIGYLDEQTPAAYPLPLRAWLAQWLDGDDAPHNVWLGATVVNYTEYIRDVYKLLHVPAVVRFLSVEPMLGPISTTPTTLRRLDWVICGGESGAGARQLKPGWVQSLRYQCEAAGVPFFFKQWGGVTPKAGGCELDGEEFKAWPVPA